MWPVPLPHLILCFQITRRKMNTEWQILYLNRMAERQKGALLCSDVEEQRNKVFFICEVTLIVSCILLGS